MIIEHFIVIVVIVVIVLVYSNKPLIYGNHTADGRNPAPVDGLSHDLYSFNHLRWFFGFLPSTVWFVHSTSPAVQLRTYSPNNGNDAAAFERRRNWDAAMKQEGWAPGGVVDGSKGFSYLEFVDNFKIDLKLIDRYGSYM